MQQNANGKSSAPTKKDTFLTRGNQALSNGNYQHAIELFNKALEQTPELAKVIEFNIALAAKRAGCPVLKRVDDTLPDAALAAEVNTSALYSLNAENLKIDIVVPVYNALEDVQRCLNGIEKNYDGYDVTTYIINDGSEQSTTNWLRRFCKDRPRFVLKENDQNKGYTPTVNIGLRQCEGDYVVTLNSDTIVTKGWISGLVRCFKRDKSIGVVGPLSNAASWQNVPQLLDENNQFAVNELPPGWTPDDMARLVRCTSKHFYPEVPFVNGFCFMISRETLDKVGLLDEATFPTGYGEENDYCIRVAEAGFKLAISDDTYVFHAKSKSFGHEQRKHLSKIGSDALKAKHGKDRVNELAGRVRDMTVFNDVREEVKKALHKSLNKVRKDPLLNRILFLLPVSGGGGGVHSIVQETMGMRRIGVRAKIAVPKKHLTKFIKKYEDINEVEDLFIGFEPNELGELSKKFDVVIGTIYTSMKLVKEIIDFNPGIQPAYYVQDYEPFFSEPGSQAWHEARESYTLVPGAILFAKTDWICQKVYEQHGVEVRKVSPSIDHDVYRPNPAVRVKDKIVVAAMIRPKTPRRGAERTMRLLKRLSNQLGHKIQIELFGCEENDPLFLKLERDFNYKNSGELTRLGVAEVLQRSDVFIDLSDYQAFGRTGLEAMACGAFILITKYGGVYEYARHLENSLIVDPYTDIDISCLVEILNNKKRTEIMKKNSILTAASYSIHRAAVSELFLFASEVSDEV